MKKLVLISALVAALSAILIPPAFSEEDSLDAKVTPLVLSVSLSEDLVDYGSLALSPADDDRSSKASQSINVTNTGSVSIDLVIEGTNASSTVAGNSPWTLNCTPSDRGTVAANQFAHRFLVGASTDWVGGQALCAASTKPLASGLAPTTGMIDFKLQMNMPTSSTGYAERTTTVVVTAVQP
jgi:hypothetical protein